MQDLETGEFIPIKSQEQNHMDAAIPDRSRQGPVFTIGEIIEIKGGRFRVSSFGKKRMIVEGMPGTSITKEMS